MAGSAKPIVVGLGIEATYTVLGVVGSQGSGGTVAKAGLLNEVCANEWNTSNVMYFSDSTTYIEIEINEDCNIWRSGTTTWINGIYPLKILKYNGTSYNDVTNLYPQTLTPINEYKWEKTIDNLPKGRYKFIGKGGTLSSNQRIDSEWYLESTSSVGKQLTVPEAGWRRYDDTDSRIKYNGTGWSYNINNTGYYNNSNNATKNSNLYANISFKFKGTKLRIIDALSNNRSNNIQINVDDTIYEYSSYTSGSNVLACLVFEISNLNNTIHSVTIKNMDTDISRYIALDAIDIDSTGYLVHPTLNQVSNLLGMAVGDCIPCRYTATTSGQAGYFSELGTCIANEIPVTGTTTPDGLFYFVKTAKGTLVADKVLQTSVTWDALNAANFIEGKPYNGNILNSVFNTSLPSNNGFTLVPTGVSGVITGNEWCLNEVNSWGSYSYQNSQVISPTSTYSFETKGRVLQGNWYVFDIYDGTKRHGIYATPTSIKATNGEPILMDMTKDRVIKIITYGQYKYELYVDNILIKTYDLSFYISTNDYTNCIMFGNLNTADSTVCYVKYFKIQYGVLLEKDALIRSLSGGCAYVDANGNKSTTDVSKGAWPVTNEWDKYIVNSDLNGKITPEDVNIWHHFRNADKGIGVISWCRDTPITGIGPNTNRILRGRYTYASSAYSYKQYVSNSASSNVTTAAGFRPVLEYIESDSKQCNLWY